MTHLKTSRLPAIGAAVVYLLLSVAQAHAQPQTPDARSLLPTLLDEVVARAKQRLIDAEARTRPLLDEIESQIELPELRAPAAEAVRVYDRPSDDGSAIIIEWLAPDRRAELRERARQQAAKLTDNPTLVDSLAAIVTEELFVNVTYLVDVAKSSENLEEDLEAGMFLTIPVTPGEATRKSGNPKYFGLARENKDYCYAEIEPAELFPPEAPTSLPERLEQLHEEGQLSDGGLARAAEAMELKASSELPGAQDLMEGQKNELAWLGRLEAFVTKEFENRLEDKHAKINAETYYVRLAVRDGEQTLYVSADGEKAVFTAQAKVNLFKWFKLNSLLFALIFSAVVLAFIQIAKRNPNLFIRRIAGLEAVEEAIGRATEMGRSVYFVHGLGGMEGMATIAAINVLGRVARRSAEYDTRVQVMNINPIVTAVSQEVVQQAYTEAGRPDAFDPDDVALVAAAQFSYAAAVAGRMVREQPAAIFLMGYFMAESLLLSESGAATGAIQVAGTDAYHQLPFFVTTCDYTLIGEELYAASAYLSREPRLLGSLRGQDVGKAFMMIVIVLSVIALTIAVAFGKDLSWIRDIFRVF